MKAIRSVDILQFLAGNLPPPGSPAERVRKAVTNPGTDPEADASLARFRAEHRDLLRTPKVLTAIHLFRSRLQKELAEAGLPAAAEAAAPAPGKSSSWRELFDQLLSYCATELSRSRPLGPDDASSPRSAGQVVSTIVSSYLRREEEGRGGDLRDPNQIWPLLIEIAARKANRTPTAEAAGETWFADKMADVLTVAFHKLARDEGDREVLARTLLGQSFRTIAKETGIGIEDEVTQTIHLLHARLHALLTAA